MKSSDLNCPLMDVIDDVATQNHDFPDVQSQAAEFGGLKIMPR